MNARDLPPTHDVRMRGFASRATVEAALGWLDGRVQQLEAETVPAADAAERVLAADVVSPRDVPEFDRAMMDGFALRGAETQGAGPYNPLELKIVGRALPGHGFAGRVEPGQAVQIMTGAPLPAGADAVLPAELCQFDAERLLVEGAVPPKKHVGPRGEDVAAGSTVLPRGRRLRPQDVGVLSSLGAAEVSVVRRPRVRIVITGDELLPAGAEPQPHKVYDANGPMLEALVARDGGVALREGITPDAREDILAALSDATADAVIVSGGSSVGEEDHAPALVAEHGELAVHGIAMRPSSPTGLGLLGGRPVFLLPGNPVSCLCAYDYFAGRAIRAMGGRPRGWPYARNVLPLGRKITSVVGRLDYARVTVADGKVMPVSIGGASILTSTTRADGFVIVPADSEGFPPGAEVEVFFYDAP